jgi:hypothetical protein
MQRVKKGLQRVRPALLLVAAVLAAASAFAIFKYAMRIGDDAKQPLTTRSPENLRGLSSIWFTPTGKLMGVAESGRAVKIFSFAEAKGQLVTSTSNPVINVDSWAAAPDGAELAVDTAAGLTFTDPWRNSESSAGLRTLAFAFMTSNKFVFIRDSEVSSHDLLCHLAILQSATSRQVVSTTKVSNPGSHAYTAISNGSYVVFVPVPAPVSVDMPPVAPHILAHVTNPNALKTETVTLPYRASVTALSTDGSIATDDGRGGVAVGRISGGRFIPRATARFDESPPLAFYGDILLAATPTQITPIPRLGAEVTRLADTANVRLIAAAPPRLAYLTTDGVLTISDVNKADAERARLWRNVAIDVAGAAFLLAGLAPCLWWWQRRQRGDPVAEPGVAPVAIEVAPPPMPFIPRELVEVVASGGAVLVVGQRAAVAAGLPDMPELLRAFVDAAEKEGSLPQREAASLRSALGRGRNELVADELATSVDAEALNRVFERVRIPESKRASAARNDLHRSLGRMTFTAVIDAGLDDLLDETLDRPRTISSGDSDRLIEALASGEGCPLIQIYGKSPYGFILGPAALRRAVFEDRRFRSAMQSLLGSNAVVFIGLSPSEVRTFTEVMDLRSVSHTQRFIIAETSPNDVVAELLRHEEQTTLLEVPYNPKARTLTVLVNQLAVAVQRNATPPDAKESVQPVRIKHVALVNIGPFESIELDLEPDWNLFLGNNGRGKSIVLRAIAAALCGERIGGATARRLLRAGATRGSIELLFGNDRYVLKLERHGQEVVARGGLSPVEVGRLLALGFPPVRTVSWARPSGPSSADRAGDASPADLRPLASSEPDSRLDDLKQWLINLDYRAKSKGEGAKAARALFLRFFKVLDDITPDVDLSFDSIDDNTYEIRVKTDGGVVPLESVSQGTTSVIGWIGVLLQRMHEVFGDLEDPKNDPEQGSALVLVDEIDAHMHPSWQQTIVGALRNLFPNVQFVVTTHSPLLVTSLESRQVLMFKRRDAKVVIERPDFDIRGLRSDQLLRTPLFDLDTVRDPEVRKRLLEYTALAARDDLDEDERRKLQEHADYLGLNLPLPQARAEARQAFALIESSLNEKIAQMPEHEKQRVLDEVKVQLQEIVSDSRRPE